MERDMRVTPVQHGKFEKHIRVLCVFLPFPLCTTDPSSAMEAKTEYYLSSSNINYETEPPFSRFCSDCRD